MRRRDLLKAGIAALSAQALPRPAFAQAGYPDRPVRLIVPFPPGGAFDTIGRPWADRIKPYLGTKFGKRPEAEFHQQQQKCQQALQSDRGTHE